MASAPTGPDSGQNRPSFDVVLVSPGGSAVVAGRAPAYAQVALLDNGEPIAHTQADDHGQFVILPDAKLPAGGQTLSLEAQVGTAPKIEGEAPAVLVVPQAPSGNASRTEVAGAAPPPPASRAVAILLPANAPPRVLQAPDSGAAAPSGEVALTVVDYDEAGAIRFAGTARAGTTVRVYIDDQAAGDAAVDAAARWALVPRLTVAPGAHRLRADDLNPLGAVLSRVELPFQRVAFASADLRDGRVVVQPGQSLWRIARTVYGHGVRYTVIFEANRSQIRDANLIYPGQIFAVPGAADRAPIADGSSSPVSSASNRTR
jgi:nucleoid-associated protein YgaU